ncbi:MAG: bis(5'-nucleosyl)-tetraphosphatase (symmetrical) YqeK [Tissierellia bacterium]|nr:bis(5'-nucleosyl)-tetraphosphatase (symmetrical) YqeK [Tissierellia bacterium]
MSIKKEYLDKLQNKIGEKRYNHSIRVFKKAMEINDALRLNIDDKKLEQAAIFHDCAKYNEIYYYDKLKVKYNIDKKIMSNMAVSHSFLAEFVAQEEYNIKDKDVLDAIKYHTTGTENMRKLTKVILLADAIEDAREYDGVNVLRKISKEDLDKAVLMYFDHTILFLITKKAPIHPETIKARNFLLRG